MENDAGALARGAHEATEGLVHARDTGNLIHAAEGLLAGETGAGGFVEAGALEGVDLGERGADDHGVRDAATECVDAFGETGTEHEEKRIGEGEGFVDPGSLRGEVAELGLDGDAERKACGEKARDRFGVSVGREENGDARCRRGVEGGDGGGGGGEVARAVVEGGVDAGIDGEVVGGVAPRGVGAEVRGGGEGGGGAERRELSAEHRHGGGRI